MPTITLPDGSQRQFDKPVTVLEVAQSIGAGLAKAAIAGKVDDKLVDTFYPIKHDVKLSIITDRDPEGLEVIRHSTAHLLAQAVKRLYPDAQVTIGPVIEDGFYYDFSYKPGFTTEDFEKIEAEMDKIVKEDFTVSRRELPRDEAVKFFRNMNEEYKAKIIEDIPQDEVLSLYQQGEFVDLCRGPHIPRTGMLKAFKLMKVSGAYWRGNADNEMLQRIYGTAWANKKDQEAYLNRIEEALKRDHRKIAKAQDLFHFQEEAPGMVFWHPNGWTMYRVLESFIREKLNKANYQEIKTPQIIDKSLWEKSGHWENFRHEMFITESESRTYMIKPMSCPAHIQIFNQGLKSYRDLPIRFAEFGCCHRNEISGALHGLMRVRGLTQDDAHIFCREDQIAAEAEGFIKLLQEVYLDFGFAPENLHIHLSTRPEQRVGSDELWDKAESKLMEVLNATKLSWQENPGDGAFYGPKIDFYLKDCIGRSWQCGTLQLDFALPGRLGAHYMGEDSTRQIPVMLHRAILGSLERFLGMLIEHYGGIFPPWLAPKQVAILNISDAQAPYATQIAETLKNDGFRVHSDLRNEKIGFKIREHTLARVPYLLVIGDREAADNTVAVRTRDGQDLGTMSLPDFVTRLQADIERRGRVKE